MALEIRPLQPDEAEELARLWRRAREENLPWLEERMGYTPDDDLRRFRSHLMEKYQVWVAAEADVPVGLMAFSPGDVDQLYVDPKYQRRGVGSALLAHAKHLSPEGLHLFTHQRNERARRFYESRGFVATAFGVSPPPESEPDVEYRWTPGTSQAAAP